MMPRHECSQTGSIGLELESPPLSYGLAAVGSNIIFGLILYFIGDLLEKLFNFSFLDCVEDIASKRQTEQFFPQVFDKIETYSWNHSGINRGEWGQKWW